MKKMWNEPVIMVEKFMPNEYVAACESGTTYLFECTAGGGVEGSVYQETNGRPGLQLGFMGFGGDKQLTSWPLSYYYACNDKHEADSTDDFLNGYYCPNGNTSNAQQVVIWRGEDGDDIHCTTKLNKNEWETAKS